MNRAPGPSTAVPGARPETPPPGGNARLRFCALIPARMQSTRLPGKPLADIGGVPMVVRVARRALASGAEPVIVCADSARIVDACAQHGIRALLTAATHPTGTDRLAEACKILGLAPDDIVVNVQGDEPFVPPAVIERVAATLAANPGCDIATAAHALGSWSELTDPNIVKVVVDARGRALLFSRAPIPWPRDAFGHRTAPAIAPDPSVRQSAPGLAPARTEAAEEAPEGMAPHLPAGLPALRHVGLYAYRAGFLLRFPGLPRPAIEDAESLEQLRALYHGCAIAVLELDAPLPPGVDTPEDLERARRNQPEHTSG